MWTLKYKSIYRARQRKNAYTCCDCGMEGCCWECSCACIPTTCCWVCCTTFLVLSFISSTRAPRLLDIKGETWWITLMIEVTLIKVLWQLLYSLRWIRKLMVEGHKKHIKAIHSKVSNHNLMAKLEVYKISSRRRTKQPILSRNGGNI